jgi:hypothetical protein
MGGWMGAPQGEREPSCHSAVLCCAVLCCAVLCCAVQVPWWLQGRWRLLSTRPARPATSTRPATSRQQGLAAGRPRSGTGATAQQQRRGRASLPGSAMRRQAQFRQQPERGRGWGSPASSHCRACPAPPPLL